MASESPQAVEQRVGHPGEKWEALREQVQAGGIKLFATVEPYWLDLMWTLDAYRIAQAMPHGFKDAGALNRSKGNWFAELVSLLLENRTFQWLGARTRVPGFSQRHQIDVAWPPRGIDPLVCCETKVMGAPAFGTTPARKALSDFVNRRKELKFAATDLCSTTCSIASRASSRASWTRTATRRRPSSRTSRRSIPRSSPACSERP
jgi:hypothetical protein